jgi:hypothetical protein
MNNAITALLLVEQGLQSVECDEITPLTEKMSELMTNFQP